MLKTCKKALLLTLIFAMLCPLNSLGAAITWDTSDMTDEVVLFENNFDSANTPNDAGVTGGATVDKTTFASEAYKNVLSIKDFSYITSANIVKYIMAGKAINVQFDYRATDTDTLRFEFREIALKKDGTSDLAYVNANQQKYWTGDATYKEIKNDGVWHSFNGTFDVASYLADLAKDANFGSYKTGKASIAITGVSRSKTVYIDNLKISAAQVPMPVNSPKVDAKWTKLADADGHTDIYKSTVAVDKALTRSCAFTGFAPGYFKTDEEYRISFSFKEDANNTNEMTRMWRMYNSDTTTSPGNSVKVNVEDDAAATDFLYFNGSGTYKKGTWYTVDKTFTVGKAGSNSDALVGNGLFTLYWESRGTEADFAYNATLNGDYTIYIADFKIERVKGASENSNTVEFAEKQYVVGGSSLSVAVSGYFNTNVYPKIMLGETTYVGEWKDVVTDGMLRTGTAYFSDVKSGDIFINDTYSVNLLIEDIWGKVKTNPLTVYFEKAQTQQVDVVRGSWVNIPLSASEKTVTSPQWINTKTTSVPQLIKDGKGLIRFSFDAQGESGKTYSKDVSASVKHGNLDELKLTIPKADLSGGASHSYSKIIDLGSLGRYGEINDNGAYKALSRIDEGSYDIYLRNSSDGTIYYKNIKLEYFDPDAASKDYVAARLSIKNNAEDRFSPKGVLIIAKYEGNTLVSVQFKNIDFKDITTTNGTALNNALGKDEKVTVYITGHDAADNTANELETNDSRYSYKAFYWNNFDDMIPLAVSEAE